jgi:hypothetical protein
MYANDTGRLTTCMDFAHSQYFTLSLCLFPCWVKSRYVPKIFHSSHGQSDGSINTHSSYEWECKRGSFPSFSYDNCDI